MAKKSGNKKTEKSKGIEAVGWGFWLICFVILYVPSWLIGKNFSYEDRSTGLFPLVVGFAIAAFGAGILSFVVNFVLQKRIEAIKKRDRKKK